MTILQYGKENGKNSVIIEAMLWDLTLPLDESTPPFPGDPALERKYLMDYRRGDEMQLSAVSFST
ncbi:MAG: hypothetical protein ONB44_22425, partial [candidate division KSB1 bacterium]|nr:hypothetical protein [candidate division KSB1 bacterium]